MAKAKSKQGQDNISGSTWLRYNLDMSPRVTMSKSLDHDMKSLVLDVDVKYTVEVRSKWEEG